MAKEQLFMMLRLDLRLMRYDVVPSCYDGYKEVRLGLKLYYIL